MADNSAAFNNLKMEIRSILIPHQKGCSLFQFRKDYKQMLGRDVPYHNFNYKDDLHLLRSIPDAVRISQFGGEYQLMAVADETTQHIQKMVAKQKPAKQKPIKSKFGPRYNTSRPASVANYPYSGTKKTSYKSYAAPVNRPSYSASVRTKPSYASQSAQFGNNPFSRQPSDSRPAIVPVKPVPIARQSNAPSLNSASIRPSESNSASMNAWANHRPSDVPPRFRAPVSSILPPDVECKIVTLVRKFPTGIRMNDFSMAYQNYFKEMFSWQKHGFASLKQCLDTIPDLVLTSLTNDFVICYVGNSSAKLQPTAEKQAPPTQNNRPTSNSGKLDDFNFSNEATPARNQPPEVFRFSASWNSPTASSEHQTQKQAVRDSEHYNLKGNSPSDEKSQYYKDSDAYKSLKPKDETKKKKADVLDTFELSSTSSCGITDKVKNIMREIMSKNKHGIFATEFPRIYEEVAGYHFDLHSLGFTDLMELVDALPDIFHRKRVEGSRKDWIIVPPEEEVVDSRSQNKSELLIECSIQNINRILQAFPEGIQVSEFLNVYSTNLKEPLYIHDLGFSCVDDFLLSISERVPLKIEKVEGIKTVFLTETEEVVSPPIVEKVPPPPIAEIPRPRVSPPLQELQQSDLPMDAILPGRQYRLLQLPADFDSSLYVPAYTSAISHPGHFYVQLEGNDTTKALSILSNDLQAFYYGPYSNQYQMRREHVKERVMCAALWPKGDNTFGDDKWYRALIIGLTQDLFKVFYVDYGTKGDVPLSMLRYLKVAYTKLPAQALKARLAHLKPPNNALSFSPEAKERMLELCMDVELMAKVEDDQDDVLSLILCNTQDEDIYINDVLLEEGLAASVIGPIPPTLLPQPQPTQQLQYPPNQVMQAQYFWQMFNALSLTNNPEEVALQMQNLSLNFRDNPLVQQASIQMLQNIPSNPVIPPPCATPCSTPPSDESEIFQDDDDLFEEFIQKSSSISKRFVKRVRTSDGYFFHMLIVDEEAFVSSGDVSHLIWNDKSPQYLLERLQTRDIIFPSHCISEKGNEAMFHQFEKFNVKGTQSNGDFSSLIIYPLQSLIPLLNMYGHPSVELRHKILMEIESFNPQLPVWQEVSEVEIQESEEDVVFLAVTDDDKLKRLCIHDLMAMKEGIRQKRNMLVRNLESDKHDESTVDELDKLEGLLQRVVVRIEQIKQICATFS